MQTIEFTTDARGVARVTLNRPDVHNAFNLTLIDELHQAFRTLEADPDVRVVVLTGAGKSFCAGADVDWMRGQAHTSPEENRATASRMQAMIEAIDQFHRPVVARVQGAALGGGSGLVCAVDIALAGPKATFGFTEVRLGIIPAVISPFVIRRLGFSEARHRCLTGSRFGAEEAGRIGMVHAVAEDLDEAVERTVKELLQGAPGAHARTKHLLRSVWDTPISDQGVLTAEATAVARALPEGREGLAAFLDKRPPSWVHSPG